MVMAPDRPRTPGQITAVKNGPREIAATFNTNYYTQAYSQGLNLSQFLEKEDPTERYPEGSRERNLDAFERVLKEAGIRVNSAPEAGIYPSTWEDCHKTSQRKALLPELMARFYRQATRWTPIQKRTVLLAGDYQPGTLANPWFDNPEIRAKRLVPPIPLDAVVARTTAIDTDAYRTIYVVDDFGTDAYRMKRIGEGAEIPATTLVTAEHTIRLHKFGRALRATYEQLRRQRIDRIAFIVARMALQAESDKVSIVIQTLINGDGNANTSAQTLTMVSATPPYPALDPLATTGRLTTTAWQSFKLNFAMTYAPDIVVGQEPAIMQLLTLPIGTVGGQVPLALLPNNPFGVIGPINDQLAGGVRYGLSVDAPTNMLVAWQSDLAIERVTEIGGNVSEVERFVTNQTQILTLTEVEGYGVIDANGVRLLDFGH